MALKKNIELNTGIKVDKAYLRVERPSIIKDSMDFYLRKYVTTDKPFFAEVYMVAPYTLDGANPFKQAYEYLKSLSEYADAVDC